MSRMLLAALVGGMSASALAGPTGLVTIPIADILGDREFAYTYSISGTEPRISKKWFGSQGFAVGIGNFVELAVTNDFSGGTDEHVRLKLLEDPKGAKWAVSVGAYGWNRGDGVHYVVGRVDFPSFRVHAGLQRDVYGRAILGVDGPIFGDATWMVEHTTGPGSNSWVGLNTPVKWIDGLDVMVAVGKPWEKGSPLQFGVSFCYGFTF